jgi:ATP-dependent protease HslVU (ClpYQ) peptidase subunit
MTTIVSLSSSTETVLLGDQGITSDLMHPNMDKIVSQKTWVIGVCGEDRVCDVLQYAVTWPTVPQTLLKKDSKEWLSWIIKTVIPVISRTVESHLPKDSWNTLNGSEALIITHGKAFLLGESLGITKAEPYWAIGSGQKLSLGYLSAVQYDNEWDTNLENKGRNAISMAQQFDPYTRGNITGYRSFANGHVVAV